MEHGLAIGLVTVDSRVFSAHPAVEMWALYATTHNYTYIKRDPLTLAGAKPPCMCVPPSRGHPPDPHPLGRRALWPPIAALQTTPLAHVHAHTSIKLGKSSQPSYTHTLSGPEQRVTEGLSARARRWSQQPNHDARLVYDGCDARHPRRRHLRAR